MIENPMSIVGGVLMIAAGLTLVATYSGLFTPTYSNENDAKRHEDVRKKRGRVYIMIGVFMLFFGVLFIMSSIFGG